jgi:hypothetical protein
MDEALFQNVAHINDLFFLKDAHVTLGILSLCVTCQPFYFTWTIFQIFFSYNFWQVSIKKLCKYVGTLWV